jgi:hypothetical protein
VAITVRVENQRGEELGFAGGDGTVNALVATADDSSVCWRFIDPYGEHHLNGLQASVLIEELDRLVAAGGTEPEGVRGLAEQCRDGIHLYLRFISD